MLTQVADGVAVRESAFCRTSTVVVQGRDGVLLVDPGVLDAELAALADELTDADRTVVAGFSTHPHWDHLLWHPRLGAPPRWATQRCADTIRGALADPGFADRVATMIPPDIVERVPMDLLGLVDGLPADAAELRWDGPRVRVLEHRAHAAGHAALLVEESGVLVAGDMLSDVLVPMLDLGAADPIGDHLAALRLLEDAAGGVDVVVPGHGSVGDAQELHARIARDRAYLHALRDDDVVDDPRIGPAAPFPWVADVHAGQARRLVAQR
ncbi:MBL fold metallo-hydrolase [Actinomycetospora sp. TBRC 11914]|uniref:MBL fold metallo-hydrolase n=1 Tax=Actinomycetospora sp. TBRC 11914 TaxID=2729387 RepID=UPI00145FBD01|nr:MBL fold metallo-hydrolase [Actinomycetospora sp. TBRC 11914]NMO88797.1 MBL fold metallo-hydrolase [Actinomycetospora sp. TBRC 11914]